MKGTLRLLQNLDVMSILTWHAPDEALHVEAIELAVLPLVRRRRMQVLSIGVEQACEASHEGCLDLARVERDGADESNVLGAPSVGGHAATFDTVSWREGGREGGGEEGRDGGRKGGKDASTARLTVTSIHALVGLVLADGADGLVVGIVPLQTVALDPGHVGRVGHGLMKDIWHDRRGRDGRLRVAGRSVPRMGVAVQRRGRQTGRMVTERHAWPSERVPVEPKLSHFPSADPIERSSHAADR